MFLIMLFLLVFVFVVVVILFKVVCMVLQGYEWMVECFGCYIYIMFFGLYFLILIVYGVGCKVNMMEQVLDVFSQEVIIKDNVVVCVDGVVFFQVFDVFKVVYEVVNLEVVMIVLVQINICIVIGLMDLDELFSQCEVINVQLLSVVDYVINLWGVKVNCIEICDIQFLCDLFDVMVWQMKVECEKCVQILEVEGLCQFEILCVEGEKQVVVFEVEGCKEVVFCDVEVCECLVEVEVKVIEMVFDVIVKGDVQVINYFIVQKYVEVFKELVILLNQKLVLMLMEVSGVIGLIVGVVELVKEVFVKQEEKKVVCVVLLWIGG